MKSPPTIKLSVPISSRRSHVHLHVHRAALATTSNAIVLSLQTDPTRAPSPHLHTAGTSASSASTPAPARLPAHGQPRETHSRASEPDVGTCSTQPRRPTNQWSPQDQGQHHQPQVPGRHWSRVQRSSGVNRRSRQRPSWIGTQGCQRQQHPNLRPTHPHPLTRPEAELHLDLSPGGRLTSHPRSRLPFTSRPPRRHQERTPHRQSHPPVISWLLLFRAIHSSHRCCLSQQPGFPQPASRIPRPHSSFTSARTTARRPTPHRDDRVLPPTSPGWISSRRSKSRVPAPPRLRRHPP